MIKRLLWSACFLYMLVVWTTQLHQSHLAYRAKTYGELLEAMAIPSPVGGYGAELAQRYYKLPQTGESWNAALRYVPEAGPWRTAILVIMTVRSGGGTCPVLMEWAPNRRDSQEMCLTKETIDPILEDKEDE